MCQQPAGDRHQPLPPIRWQAKAHFKADLQHTCCSQEPVLLASFQQWLLPGRLRSTLLFRLHTCLADLRICYCLLSLVVGSLHTWLGTVHTGKPHQ
jgi:hypothetical protein